MLKKQKGFIPHLFGGKSQITERKENRKKGEGFTLIELLVVVAIIGLLSSMISLAVNSSRTKARDTRRITDMKQIKTGMDIYFTNGSGYPAEATWTAAEGSTLSCGDETVMQVPQDPLTPTYDYTYSASGDSYTGCGTTVRGDYEVRFYIENQGAYFRMDSDGNVTTDGGASTNFDELL